jgi:hypothetical protein
LRQSLRAVCSTPWGGLAVLFFRTSSTLLRALAQREFLDLAGGGFWERAEDHSSRRLEMGEVGAAEGDDVFRRGFGFGLQGHKGARCFAPHRIGTRHHRRFEHGGVSVEDIFDLDRRDVLAA